MYEEMLVIMTLLLLIYALMIPLILNTDDKVKHIRWSSLGLKNVIKSCEGKDIQRVSHAIKLLYDEYIQEKPSAKKYFANIIVWLDTIILRISTESKSVKCVAEHYELLRNVRDFLDESNPYSNCTEYQQGILNDICGLKTDNNEPIVNNILGRTESEFIRLESDIRKNERSNKLSLMIGILGIAVSVLLAIIKF